MIVTASDVFAKSSIFLKRNFHLGNLKPSLLFCQIIGITLFFTACSKEDITTSLTTTQKLYEYISKQPASTVKNVDLLTLSYARNDGEYYYCDDESKLSFSYIFSGLKNNCLWIAVYDQIGGTNINDLEPSKDKVYSKTFEWTDVNKIELTQQFDKDYTGKIKSIEGYGILHKNEGYTLFLDLVSNTLDEKQVGSNFNYDTKNDHHKRIILLIKNNQSQKIDLKETKGEFMDWYGKYFLVDSKYYSLDGETPYTYNSSISLQYAEPVADFEAVANNGLYRFRTVKQDGVDDIIWRISDDTVTKALQIGKDAEFDTIKYKLTEKNNNGIWKYSVLVYYKGKNTPETKELLVDINKGKIVQ